MQNLPTIAAQPAANLPVNSVQDLKTLGEFFAASELFGTANAAQGFAIVAMCHQKRISWMDFMQNFHMIKGKVSKKADAMLAHLDCIGGTHKIICRTPDKASCYLKKGDAEYTSTITWEECLREPFPYQGGKEEDIINAIANGFKWPNGRPLEIKAKYRTPRSRMQMLWARCVSDGVGVVAPECKQGVYTPEETDDFVEVPAGTAMRFATPVPSAAMTEAQAVVSPSPQSVEEVPCGPLMGKRWDGLDTPVLQQALEGTNPLITTEMKDYIRNVLLSREMAAPAADKREQEVTHV